MVSSSKGENTRACRKRRELERSAQSRYFAASLQRKISHRTTRP